MKNMSAGAAPLKEYVAWIGRLDGDVFASGNRDNVSRSPNVLKQIACESRAKDRLDISELDSLMQLQLKYCAEDKKKMEKCVDLFI